VEDGLQQLNDFRDLRGVVEDKLWDFTEEREDSWAGAGGDIPQVLSLELQKIDSLRVVERFKLVWGHTLSLSQLTDLREAGEWKCTFDKIWANFVASQGLSDSSWSTLQKGVEELAGSLGDCLWPEISAFWKPGTQKVLAALRT
jgi:hypothetical protein